uniref:Uncharacterized protein n=1 Tax=Anopheles farauti TaxID=69004 RepID=A0A182QDD9_9DIPT
MHRRTRTRTTSVAVVILSLRLLLLRLRRRSNLLRHDIVGRLHRCDRLRLHRESGHVWIEHMVTHRGWLLHRGWTTALRSQHRRTRHHRIVLVHGQILARLGMVLVRYVGRWWRLGPHCDTRVNHPRVVVWWPTERSAATIVPFRVVVHLVVGLHVGRVDEVRVAVERCVVIHLHVRGGHEEGRTGRMLGHIVLPGMVTGAGGISCSSGPGPTSAGPMYAPVGVAVVTYGDSP